MGRILEVEDGSADLILYGSEQIFKIFKRMRRGVIIKDGNILPGPRRSRLDVPFVSNLEVAVWICIGPERTFIKRFTSLALYRAAVNAILVEQRQASLVVSKKTRNGFFARPFGRK